MQALVPIGVFTALATALLMADLLLLRRGAVRLSLAEASARTGFFGAVAVAMATLLAFGSNEALANLGVAPATIASGNAAAEFLQAYLVEITLSVDNVLVIALIFTHFRLSPVAQHKVLFWGVLGAFLMRGILILFGAGALERFAWATYAFGALLFWSAIRLLRESETSFDVSKSPIYRWGSRMLRVESGEHGDRFFLRSDRGWRLSALALPLVIIEATDLLFAVDSIPAVLAITRDPVLAYASNLVAVLGMRSLYFLVVPLLAQLRHLRLSLVVVLMFIAVKLLLEHSHPISTNVSLAVTVSVIVIGVLASLVDPRPTSVRPRVQKATRAPRVTALNLRSARRAVVLVVGSTVLILGALLAVLAAPGVLVLIGALALLSTEFAWARLWLRRVRRVVQAAQRRAGL